MKKRCYYVYILQCDGDSYYTGYTSDIKSRLLKHKTGHAARYTRMHTPRKLAFMKTVSSQLAAMRLERQIKRLSHNRKRELTQTQEAKLVLRSTRKMIGSLII